MRKFIIDTDTGSDDAVALIMALKSPQVKVLGITTVCGNIPEEQATKNALMTAQLCGSSVPVYPGMKKPLMRELVTAVNVHGQDGMGDGGLIHPDKAPCSMHAVDYLIEEVSRNPGEIEIIALAPVTNLALSILRAPEVMSKVKRIYTMGTSGFGPGNITPVAEFNVCVDAESYDIMLRSGIPITIIGFDLCTGEATLNRRDIEILSAGGPMAKFSVDCNKALISYNLRRSGEYVIDLPDAVAMAVALWDDIVLDRTTAYCHCCTKEERAYGQVIIYPKGEVFSMDYEIPPDNAVVIKKIDVSAYKERLMALLNQ